MLKTQFLGSCSNGIFCVDGVDLFQCKWKTTGQCAVVLDPRSKEPYTFSVYETDLGDTPFSFAAGELKPGTWFFYLVT